MCLSSKHMWRKGPRGICGWAMWYYKKQNTVCVCVGVLVVTKWGTCFYLGYIKKKILQQLNNDILLLRCGFWYTGKTKSDKKQCVCVCVCPHITLHYCTCSITSQQDGSYNSWWKFDETTLYWPQDSSISTDKGWNWSNQYQIKCTIICLSFDMSAESILWNNRGPKYVNS